MPQKNGENWLENRVTLYFTVAFAVYELVECGALIKVEENNFLFSYNYIADEGILLRKIYL